jgi:hypothetical protein
MGDIGVEAVEVVCVQCDYWSLMGQDCIYPRVFPPICSSGHWVVAGVHMVVWKWHICLLVLLDDTLYMLHQTSYYH